MKNWNDMTPGEREMLVLTKVCGWRYYRCERSGNDWWVTPDGEEFGIHEVDILTSADAAIEHVGKAIEEKGYAWHYVSHPASMCVISNPGSVVDRNVKWSNLSTGFGDLAPALSEAAWRMKEGEEG